MLLFVSMTDSRLKARALARAEPMKNRFEWVLKLKKKFRYGNHPMQHEIYVFLAPSFTKFAVMQTGICRLMCVPKGSQVKMQT